MNNLYEKDYQVRSVIAKYHREARDANHRRSIASGRGYGPPAMMHSMRQRLAEFVHGARRAHHHASTALDATPPAPAAHHPK